MIAEKNNVVSLTYELRTPDGAGDIVEVADQNNPLVFLFGAGGMLEAFEKNLTGLKSGDSFEFTLESHEAYGPVEEEALIDLPIESFMVEGQVQDHLLKPGNVLTMRDEHGYPLRATVVSRGIDKVKMDFNHPMAGKNLNFRGVIIEIRPATQEELAHGHVHGPGGHHH